MPPKVLYLGLSPSNLGDQSHQIIIQTGELLGISILGPCQRADATYGLEHVEDEGFSNGVEATLQNLLSGSGEYCVAPLRFSPDNPQPGDTCGRGKTPPFRLIQYTDFPDKYTRIPAHQVQHLLELIQSKGETGVTKESLPEHLRNNIFGYLIAHPELFLVTTHSGWRYANPNPRNKPAECLWSLCAPAFLGTYGNPEDRSTHVYGLFCYSKTWNAPGQEDVNGWIAATQNGIICEEAGYQEVPESYLENITYPPEFREFMVAARQAQGWASANTFPVK